MLVAAHTSRPPHVGGRPTASFLDSQLWDTEEAFLTLDDVVEEAADVDLVEDPLDGQEAPGVERHRMREPPSILQMVGAGLDEGADQPPKMSTLWVHRRGQGPLSKHAGTEDGSAAARSGVDRCAAAAT